jgi:hypothetical protein
VIDMPMLVPFQKASTKAVIVMTSETSCSAGAGFGRAWAIAAGRVAVRMVRQRIVGNEK